MKANGYGFVLVQAVSPPFPYPPGQTKQQCQAVLDAGLGLDAYVYLWFSETVAQLTYRLGLLDGFPIRRLWLDVEDTSAGFRPSSRTAMVTSALKACDAYPTRLKPTGIYTGRWFWEPNMANTTRFSHRPLWDANYVDGVADASVGFVPYGGWTSCAIKQYAGSSILLDIHDVDLDAYSPEEAAA